MSPSAGRYRYQFMPPDLFLDADAPIDYTTLYEVRSLCEDVFDLTARLEREQRRNQLLEEETRKLQQIDASFMVDDRYIAYLFAFLGDTASFAILRSDELVAQSGVSDLTVNYCLHRLSHQAEFDLPIGSGELYAVDVEGYRGIFESMAAISDSLRHVIKLKLNWLATKHREKRLLQELRSAERRTAAAPGTTETVQQNGCSANVQSEYDEAEREFLHLMEQAITDPLTGIYNKRKALEVLDRELGEVQQRGGTFGVLMFDIDHFKAINDRYGHGCGDRVLETLVRRTQRILRMRDAFARWGGEEFLIVLPEATIDDAAATAERVRECIAADPFERKLRLTCSFGVGAWDGEIDSDNLIARVDEALYRAKSAGRNTVVLASRQ